MSVNLGNLRHLRVYLAVADTGSVTRAAARCHVSQPAVTQAINKLEKSTGSLLFERTRRGFFVTEQGSLIAERLKRAFALLDPALESLSPRLRVTATKAQLNAVIAVRETENFTLAARRMGLAQPTVHRAISQIETEAGRELFEKTSFGMVATRQTKSLAQAARLAFAELDQAEADLAEHVGSVAGRLVVGALPLARSVILPRALTKFRAARPSQPVTVVDGLYSELLGGLRRGDIDVIIGALREPAPIGDIVQEKLFEDQLVMLARPDHPLVERSDLSRGELKQNAWVVPRHGTPSRDQFDRFFGEGNQPESIIEAGSILLMREILIESDHLGCISRAQAEAEISKGLLKELEVDVQWRGRPIGLTYRQSWSPTKAQSLLLDLIRTSARNRKSI